jgi:hypothetical protein
VIAAVPVTVNEPDKSQSESAIIVSDAVVDPALNQLPELEMHGWIKIPAKVTETSCFACNNV